MSLEVFQNDSSKILDCEVKDESGLNDFQKLPNQYGIAIPKVGIERFRLPLNFVHPDGTLMSHDCEASMFIYLEEGKTGVNMSRFCTILQEEGLKHNVDKNFLETILGRYRKDLRDELSDPLIPASFLKLKFLYPVKQQSLKSGNWGWQYYPVEIMAEENDLAQISVFLTLKYEYSSTCPCSLSLAKQYEDEYRNGKTQEGNGIASAHSQRSVATLTVKYALDEELQIEDVLKLLRTAIPTETQSLVKRVDEQAFAILNGENPVFVEHATRRLSYVLDQDKRVLDWIAKVEHLESLHSHNAVATIYKAGGEGLNLWHKLQ